MLDWEQMKNKATRQMGASSTGFTIVELLIVVVVIAILAAITIVAYNGITQRAGEAAVQSAAAQAQKKLAAWRVLNADAIPASLEEAGVTVTGSTQYQYTVVGTGFCITATQNNRAAYVGSNYVTGGSTVNQATPANGACPGHSATSGSSPIIRNLVTNPSFETDTNGWGVSSSNMTRSTGVWADSGTYSLRVGNSGTTNSGDVRIVSSASTMPFGMEAGKTYTISARLYFTAAFTGAGFTRAPGILTWISTNGSSWVESFGAKPSSTPGTYTVTNTVTLPANTTGVLIGLGTASSTTGQYFYYDSIMVEEGSTAHTYGDGASTNWAWLGTAHASASTGPAL